MGTLETGEKRKEKSEESNHLSEANWLRRIFLEHRSVPVRAVSSGRPFFRLFLRASKEIGNKDCAFSFGLISLGRAKKGT
jgi:hypothetical protein